MIRTYTIQLSLFFLLLVQVVSCQSANETYSPRIEAQQFSEQSEQPNYKIDVNYPQFQSLPNREIQEQINQQLQELVLKQVKAFKVDLRRSFVANPDRFVDVSSQLLIQHEIGLMSKHIASLKMTVQNDNAAAAYPQYNEYTYTFNIQTGQSLKLSDLCQADTDCLERIAQQARQAIQEQKVEEDIPVNERKIAQYTQADSTQHFEQFVLYDDHFQLYFYYYPISDQRSPDNWVTIPYTSLKEVLQLPYNEDLLKKK